MKSNSSDTDGTESERDRDCSGSGCNDDEDSEVWHEDVDDLFLRCDKWWTSARTNPTPIIYTDTDNIN